MDVNGDKQLNLHPTCAKSHTAHVWPTKLWPLADLSHLYCYLTHGHLQSSTRWSCLSIWVCPEDFVKRFLRLHHMFIDSFTMQILTSIAGLVHVNDFNPVTTQILVPPCHTCSVYAIKEFGYPPKIFRHLWKNPEVAENLRWVTKLLYGIYPTDVTWRDQNLGRKVEVIYMDEPCNAC